MTASVSFCYPMSISPEPRFDSCVIPVRSPGLEGQFLEFANHFMTKLKLEVHSCNSFKFILIRQEVDMAHPNTSNGDTCQQPS